MSPATPRPDGRWLVVGSRGMLGTELLQVLADRDVTGLDLPEIDITDQQSVHDQLAGFDVVVNCAAWTAVDDAEIHEDAAYAVNAGGPANLAHAASDHGSWLIQISTDYVFDGLAITPYAEDAPLAPRTAYGRTKAAGETAVEAGLADRSYLIRTAWLYGANGPNFVSTMSRLAHGDGEVQVVGDQVGQPTWARDLAQRIVEVTDVGAPAGRYHATAAGETSWFELARRVFQLAGAPTDRLKSVTTAQYPSRTPRPAYSVLGHEKWATVGLGPMRDWDAALADAWENGVANQG